MTVNELVVLLGFAAEVDSVLNYAVRVERPTRLLEAQQEQHSLHLVLQ